MSLGFSCIYRLLSALLLYSVYLVEVVYTRIPDPCPIVFFEVWLLTIFCLLFTSIVLFLLIITVYYLGISLTFLFFFPLQSFNGGY